MIDLKINFEVFEIGLWCTDSLLIEILQTSMGTREAPLRTTTGKKPVGWKKLYDWNCTQWLARNQNRVAKNAVRSSTYIYPQKSLAGTNKRCCTKEK